MVLDPGMVECGYLGGKLEDDNQLERADCQARQKDGETEGKEGLAQQASGHCGLPKETIEAAATRCQGAQHEEA
jgi:hypothetical protein